VGNVCGGKPAHEISLIAPKAAKQTDAIFDIEREINDKNASARLATQQERSCPLVESLRSWLIEERSKLSTYNGVAKAIDCFTTPKHGGDKAAVMCILIVTAKMNDIDPQAWVVDVLALLPNIIVSCVHELLPWH
jgi:hypothetical protein